MINLLQSLVSKYTVKLQKYLENYRLGCVLDIPEELVIN